MSEIQGLREQILANTKYLALPDLPRPKQKTSLAYELLIAHNTPGGYSIADKRTPPTTTTAATAAFADLASSPSSYKALLLTPPTEGAHIRIEGPDAETVEGALKGMLEVTAGMVREEMKRRGADVIKGDEILDVRGGLGNGVLVVMRVPDEAMETDGGEGGGDGEGDGAGERADDEGNGGAGGKVEGKRGPGRPRKAGGGGATAAAAAAADAAVDGEGRVVKRGRGRPKKNAG
ncbi:hypothetical protein KC363_g4996 [Hortaea werneckii]|nr:hypothetical protein KC359_g537 [Hortaea werneckii]KAI7177705.1 hypothetical protein KC360_g2069 [Hortaea werneckii]KAI7189316.1 hypothetical protein KC363_g4996 [Hortaea werneckii]KAI7508808.1 hypothetical protein KC347_g5809 [Hortaea werneckii]